MTHLTSPEIIIKESIDSQINKFLTDSLKSLYEELDLFCEKNSNYDFGEWFSERSFLSMYTNSIIRNDSKERKISIVQEYLVTNHLSRRGFRLLSRRGFRLVLHQQ